MKNRKLPYPERRIWGVSVETRSKKLKLTKKWITSLTTRVLEGVDDEVLLPFVNEVSLHIVTDKEIAVLNAEHRGKPKPTDVLSFPTFEPKEVRGKKRVIDTFQNSLGDVVISADTTLAQAVEFNVTPKEEFVRLVVHGLLHLCGYDHEGVPPSEAQRMRRKERKLRKAVINSLELYSNSVRKKRGESSTKKGKHPISKSISSKRTR